MMRKFLKWLQHLDNGQTHFNPFANEITESIGFSPYDCITEDIYTVDELFDKFIKLTNHD